MALAVVRRSIVLLCAFVCATGCGRSTRNDDGSDAALLREPIGYQIIRADPALKSEKFSALLTFEDDRDLVFVRGSSGAPALDRAHAHTGHASLRITQATAPKLSVKLSSLLSGRSFPGNWALAGGYLYSQRPRNVTIRCDSGGKWAQRALSLPAGQWTAAMLDLSPLQGASGDAVLTFAVDDAASAGPLWIDDVMVIDNEKWLVGGRDVDPPLPWSVRRKGYKIVGERPKVFRFALDSAEGKPEGWQVIEANPWRCRFESSGKSRYLTIYADGRSYRDGRFEGMNWSLKSEPLYAADAESPGDILVAEDLGRVNRSTPGDTNNDGYNEAAAAYELIATGPRLELKLSPRAVPLVRPVLEISGMPAGQVLVTVEGRLVDDIARLDDGRLLLELPVRIDRPTIINVRIE